MTSIVIYVNVFKNKHFSDTFPVQLRRDVGLFELCVLSPYLNIGTASDKFQFDWKYLINDSLNVQHNVEESVVLPSFKRRGLIKSSTCLVFIKTFQYIIHIRVSDLHCLKTKKMVQKLKERCGYQHCFLYKYSNNN